MSADIVIRSYGLSKKYLIGHETTKKRYSTVPEALGHRAKTLVRTASEILRGRAFIDGAKTEEVWALKDVTFEVKRGDIIGIIGRNGAGKSTLLKVLSRITEPSEGSVEIRGRVASLLEIGTGFHPELSGRENIYLNGSILGMARTEIRRKFDEIVAFAEVERFVDTPVKRYSSGMYVRLAFAVAAHLESEILILDEVLAVGDMNFQRKCLAKMEDVAGQGRTIIFVSHNMALVRSLCTRASVLDGGRIANHGSVEEAIEFYVNSDRGADSFVSWSNSKAPRCPEVAFKKAWVLDADGRPTSLVDCRSDFSIVLEYEILKPMKHFRIGIRLQNGVGVCVTDSTDWGAWARDVREPGFYRDICRYPGNVLNHGAYSIAFAADASPHLEPLLMTDYCLSFSVEDMEGHGPLSLRVPGVVKPQVEWTVTEQREPKSLSRMAATGDE